MGVAQDLDRQIRTGRVDCRRLRECVHVEMVERVRTVERGVAHFDVLPTVSLCLNGQERILDEKGRIVGRGDQSALGVA